MQNSKILSFGDWYEVYEKAGMNFKKAQQQLESKIFDTDLEKTASGPIQEQNNVTDAVSKDFTRSSHPNRFKYGVVKTEDQLDAFVNWYSDAKSSSGLSDSEIFNKAVAILKEKGLNPKQETDRYDLETARHNISSLVRSISDNLATLSMYPPKYVNSRFIKTNIKVDDEITKKYRNYPEVLLEIYKQQLEKLGASIDT